MKFLIPAIFLILGLSIGYIAGKNSNQPNKTLATKNITSKPKVEIIYDTIVKKTIVEVEKKSDSSKLILDTLQVDSLLKIKLDTTTVNYIKKNDSLIIDTTHITEEQININSDKKLLSKTITIIYLDKTKTSKSDSLINQLIKVNPIKNQQIIIDFWESPINYSGYKMSKSKLIVYGLNPHFNYKLYAKKGKYFLNFEQVFYQLEETSTFKPYITVKKAFIFND